MTRLATTLFFVTLASAHADTLIFRNGTALTGNWIGIDARQISFQVNGEIRTYPRSDVSKVTFEPAVSPKKVELGMTITEVVAILGQPEAVAETGTKQVYSYKTSKVTFVDGKVSDIQ
jgi:outer membrane protein assembly factor BamE (lipoprotein component of BamABCDE complex)